MNVFGDPGQSFILQRVEPRMQAGVQVYQAVGCFELRVAHAFELAPQIMEGRRLRLLIIDELAPYLAKDRLSLLASQTVELAPHILQRCLGLLSLHERDLLFLFGERCLEVMERKTKLSRELRL